MEQIINIINEIKAKDQNWDKHEELSDIDLGEQNALVNNLFRKVRELLKKKQESSLETIKQQMENDTLYNSLIGTAEKSLWHFRAWEVVRRSDRNEGGRTQILFQNIMEKYVLRVDFDFQNTYGLYDIDNPNIFHDLLQSYDVLVAYYIRYHFSKRTIIEDIMEETDIIKEDAEIFADIFERHYKELQINFIIDELSKENKK